MILNILVTETWSRSVFENWKNYLVKVVDFCYTYQILLKKKKSKYSWYVIYEVHRKAVESFAKEEKRFGCKMYVIIYEMKTKTFWWLKMLGFTIE